VDEAAPVSPGSFEPEGRRAVLRRIDDEHRQHFIVFGQGRVQGRVVN
jgi:hypothetical protein